MWRSEFASSSGSGGALGGRCWVWGWELRQEVNLNGHLRGTADLVML